MANTIHWAIYCATEGGGKQISLDKLLLAIKNVYLMYSIVLLLRLNLFGMLYCRMNSEKWLMAGKQDKIYFTPDFLFKLALEWNISKRSFHQLRLDQGLWPQTTKLPSSWLLLSVSAMRLSNFSRTRWPECSVQLCFYFYPCSTLPHPHLHQMCLQWKLLVRKPNRWNETSGN